MIGPNGAGKSTLLRILAGLEKQDDGALSLRRGLRVGYLAQQDLFEDADGNLSARATIEQALRGLNLEDYEVDMRAEAGLAG